MLRILVVAILLASGMYGLKEAGVLDRTGLLGTCEVVAHARTEEGEWQACRGGSISGSPDLSRDSCRKGVTRGRVTYWYCPEKLADGGTG